MFYKLLLYLVILLAFTSRGVQAADYNVPDDFLTINEAIDAANASGGGTVHISAGPYNEPVVLKSNVWLEGERESGELATRLIGTSFMCPIVRAIDVTNVGITNLKIIASSNFDDSGGGVYCENSERVFILGNEIIGNYAWVGGGGICFKNSRGFIGYNKITGNYAHYGGGICVEGSESDVQIYNNLISGNLEGGGIHIKDKAYTYISDNSISSNETGYSSAGGGGIFMLGVSTTVIKDNTLSGNLARAKGGGIYCIDSSLTVTENLIAGNEASNTGGGLALLNSSGKIENNEIYENNAESGGAIACTGSLTSISGNRIESNHAYTDGGGIYCQNAAPVISENILMYNEAGSLGGGIYLKLNNSYPDIYNCVIAKNTAHAGGGIYATLGALPTIYNCTVYYNTASLDSGIGCLSGHPVIYNTIIWQNYCLNDYNIS